jgi:type VI protein secretion system component VasK
MSDIRGIGLLTAVLVVALVWLATPAFAYIGPGAGITVLGALWGIIVTVFVALGAVLLWPIRGLFRRRRARARQLQSDAAADPAAAPAESVSRDAGD